MELGLNQEQEKHLLVLKSLPPTDIAVARMWELWLASSVPGGCQAFNLLLLENILSYLSTGVKIGNKVILIFRYLKQSFKNFSAANSLNLLHLVKVLVSALGTLFSFENISFGIKHV